MYLFGLKITTMMSIWASLWLLLLMIPKGSIAVFHGTKIDTSAKRFNFNLYNIKGVAEMYIDKCTSYPDCTYDPKKLSIYYKPCPCSSHSVE